MLGWLQNIPHWFPRIAYHRACVRRSYMSGLSDACMVHHSRFLHCPEDCACIMQGLRQRRSGLKHSACLASRNSTSHECAPPTAAVDASTRIARARMQASTVNARLHDNLTCELSFRARAGGASKSVHMCSLFVLPTGTVEACLHLQFWPKYL